MQHRLYKVCRLTEVGTYTNLGGLVTTAGKINDAYFDGTTWKLIAVDLPKGDKGDKGADGKPIEDWSAMISYWKFCVL